MLVIRFRILICVLACLLLAGLSGPAQGRPPDRGDDHTPLGGLGCEGDVVDHGRSSKVFEITTLEENGPARVGGLREGDLIYSLNGKSLPERGDAVLALSRQVELSEASKSGTLDVVVIRQGKKTSLTLKVECLGPHSKSCPLKCGKCARVRSRAVEFLVQNQSDAGGWVTRLGGNNGQVVVSSLCGLALKGAGKQHRPAVSKALEHVLRTCGAPGPFDRIRSQRQANWNQVNWQLAYAPLFLTSVRQNVEVRNKLGEIARKLIENQEGSGGYAHGPGGPNALGYLELEIVSNHALASLGLMRDYGISLDEVGVQSGLDYVLSCMAGDGGIAYSTRPGQAGHGDPGRTAGAYFALYRNNLGRSKAARKMLKFFKRGMDRLPSGHVSPMMHLLAGAMACTASPQKRHWKEYWKTYRPYIMSSRLHSGAFAARPTRESQAIRSNTDRTLGHCWTTGTLVIILNLALDPDPYPHLFKPPKRRPKP